MSAITPKIQSPYLFCQAAGSDGSDESFQGVHLRWDLLHELGYNHMAKGSLYYDKTGTEDGFNKQDDYIQLFRASYNSTPRTIIHLNDTSESQISFLPDFEGLICSASVNGSTNNTLNNVIVRFLDKVKARYILQTLHEGDKVQEFLNRYDGIYEIEVEGKLMYRYTIEYNHDPYAGVGDFCNPSEKVKVETISNKVRYDKTKREVIHRDEFEAAYVSNGIDVTGENIEFFRLQRQGLPKPDRIIIETYEDTYSFFQETNQWQKVGDFGLSLRDEQVFEWFQGKPFDENSGLQLSWLKYNNGTYLNAHNYLDRWNAIDDGLKTMVDSFINESINDPRANVNYNSDATDDVNTMTVSLLDMLKLVALDYHGARMLGLGYLDQTPTSVGSEQKFMYCVKYVTYPELKMVGENVEHIAMSLPTCMKDLRLPTEPILLPISYGLYVNDDSSLEPKLLSDSNGYTYLDAVRFVNLKKENQNTPQTLLNVIPDNAAFDTTQITQPIAFGIEYRDKDDSEWRETELLHDDVYLDSNGNFESAFVPENDREILYTHKEYRSSEHEYALYSINCFSRVSPLSNAEVTDYTSFSSYATLIPPSNLSGQYIQEEDPLIFTTQTEQNILSVANQTNPTGDNYQTRVCFEWDNIHNNAYQRADQVEFFFRESPVAKVEGKIKSVTSISETQCQIETTSFILASASPAKTILPVIPSGEEAKFVDSYLNTTDGQFKVVSITQSSNGADGPIFIVDKNKSTQVIQADPSDPYAVMPIYQSPKSNEIFFVTENINDINQWTKLAKKIDIQNFSDYEEEVFEPDGSSHFEKMGGIIGKSTITEILEQTEVNVNGVIQTVMQPTGGYTVAFTNSVSLNPHPDLNVHWHKGSAIFSIAGSNLRKKLRVVTISRTSPLKIVVYDPEYFTNPTNRIQIGNNVSVNYHPSYKIYLSPESGLMDKTMMLPVGNQTNKKTYLAVRSIDSTNGKVSQLSTPLTLVARNIQKPVTPTIPLSSTFATRPDFYGKSTYTFDIQLNTTNRTPYGVIVYRSNEMAILQSLYLPSTVKQIVADLQAIEQSDSLKFNRWLSLLEVETEVEPNNSELHVSNGDTIGEDVELVNYDNLFKKFGNYRFPNPDNNLTEVFVDSNTVIHPFPLLPSETIKSQKTVIKKVIEDIFNPVTETPIVFEFLKYGTQTLSSPPQVRDIVGKVLDPSDSAFNPFPMAVKFPNTNPNTIRFTDYTINGAAQNIYFYYVKETSLQMQLSERTPFIGPISLINAKPANIPKVRKIIAREENQTLGIPAAIQFELAEYIESEKIDSFQVFRSKSILDTASTKTMKLAATIQVGNNIEDVFADLQFPPFSQPLFYRIVALRKIKNEKNQLEYIPSEPSEVLFTSIMDVVNPKAPILNHTSVINSSGDLTNLQLQWSPLIENATYYVYKMNEKGNWKLIEQLKSNKSQIEFPSISNIANYQDFVLLKKTDDNGNTIYHRFKVVVENANGLFSIEENTIVV